MTNLVKEKEYGVNINRDSYVRGIVSLICTFNDDTAKRVTDYLHKNHSGSKLEDLSNDSILNAHIFVNRVFQTEVALGRAIIGVQPEGHNEKVEKSLMYMYR